MANRRRIDGKPDLIRGRPSGQGPAVSGGLEPPSELSSGAGPGGASPAPVVVALPLAPPPGWAVTAGPVVIPAAARAAAACWPAGTAAVAAADSTSAEPAAEGLSAPEPRPAGASSPGPPNAAVTAFSAVVTSLGITQNVLPAPAASCGSVCRYW